MLLIILTQPLLVVLSANSEWIYFSFASALVTRAYVLVMLCTYMYFIWQVVNYNASSDTLLIIINTSEFKQKCTFSCPSTCNTCRCACNAVTYMSCNRRLEFELAPCNVMDKSIYCLLYTSDAADE